MAIENQRIGISINGGVAMVASIIISVCASIISGMVLFFLQRYFKRKRKEDEERDKAKAKQNILILKSINAVGKTISTGRRKLPFGHGAIRRKSMRSQNCSRNIMKTIRIIFTSISLKNRVQVIIPRLKRLSAADSRPICST